MASGLLRLLAVFWVFGWGAYALGGGFVGVAAAAVVAIAINRLWRFQQNEDRLREHREQVIADEELKLEVRERQAKP